ncbi:MAG TPA: tetratricopeptide repeat protein, partial [bacterium]|nr:tetratricopeptide repeat protein [bacterium]
TASRYTNGPGFYDALGRAYAAAGKPDEAAQYFESALAIDPWKSEVWRNLAQVFAWHGREAEAARALKNAAVEPGSNVDIPKFSQYRLHR